MAAMMRSAVSTLDARHPVRPDLGLCVAQIRAASGCRTRCPDAELLRASFHIMVLCTGGNDTQVVDFQDVHHRPGSLLWIPSGTVHERVPAIQGRAVCFTAAFLSPGSPQISSPVGGMWNLQGSDLDEVTALVTVLDNEYARYVSGPTGAVQARSLPLLRHLLCALVMRVQSVPRERAASNAVNPVVRDFLDMVEAQCCTMHTVEEYAAALGYSARTLQRVCYEEVGTPPRQVIDERVSAEAERLLALTDMPVAAVAHTVGFGDAANFSKFFQRQTGQTPGSFRRQLLS